MHRFYCCRSYALMYALAFFLCRLLEDLKNEDIFLECQIVSVFLQLQGHYEAIFDKTNEANMETNNYKYLAIKINSIPMTKKTPK